MESALSFKRIILLNLCVLNLFHNILAQVFTKVDSIAFSNAQIWGVCSDKGDSLCVTTTFNPFSKPHLFLRKVNYTNISQSSSLKQLTFDSDFTSIPNLTDHKSIVLNNEIFIAFSTIGDQDLYLFKTDINGNRIGNIVTVVSGSPDPTNDMILVTDGTYIYVLHFDPPDQHHVYKFNTNLVSVSSPFSTSNNGHNNLGNAIFMNNIFYMFTGSGFGFNSNLRYTSWNNNWGSMNSQDILTSIGGDGNFFSTGVVFDNVNLRWYIAMNHINSGQSIGQEHIDLLAFDNSFNLLERNHITSTGSFRPHLVLKNGYLYLTYDRNGSGVYLIKYQVQNVSGISEVNNNHYHFTLFPQPFSDFCVIQSDTLLHNATLTFINSLGEKIFKLENLQGKEILFNRMQLPAGIYFFSIDENGVPKGKGKCIISD
ncbi:MAG: hypothetical protein KatS3mg027_1370 [Bacteroidia bacterium]|nr:MAG: hypothetical protein KatS3mg027_1370 [Bacteroidia bacterium]